LPSQISPSALTMFALRVRVLTPSDDIVCGGGDAGQANVAASTPLWIFHGALDQSVNVTDARLIVQPFIDRRDCAGEEHEREGQIGVDGRMRFCIGLISADTNSALKLMPD
jgi:hypothetical protein